MEWHTCQSKYWRQKNEFVENDALGIQLPRFRRRGYKKNNIAECVEKNIKQAKYVFIMTKNSCILNFRHDSYSVLDIMK